MNKLTVAAVRKELAALNMTIRSSEGEYRVAFKVLHNSPEAREDAEASAYYTDDLEDALNTAHAMREHARDFGQSKVNPDTLHIQRHEADKAAQDKADDITG